MAGVLQVGVVAQGREHILQRLPLAAVHVHLSGGGYRTTQVVCQPACPGQLLLLSGFKSAGCGYPEIRLKQALKPLTTGQGLVCICNSG